MTIQTNILRGVGLEESQRIFISFKSVTCLSLAIHNRIISKSWHFTFAYPIYTIGVFLTGPDRHIKMFQIEIFLHGVEAIIAQGEVAAVDVYTAQTKTSKWRGFRQGTDDI